MAATVEITATVVTVAATTEPARAAAASGAAAPHRRPVRAPDPDRVSIILFSLTAVLLVLALLATQLTPGASPSSVHRQIVIRRIYQTTVVESVPGPGKQTSTSQSISSSGSGALPSPAVSTRSSGG